MIVVTETKPVTTFEVILSTMNKLGFTVLNNQLDTPLREIFTGAGYCETLAIFAALEKAFPEVVIGQEHCETATVRTLVTLLGKDRSVEETVNAVARQYVQVETPLPQDVLCGVHLGMDELDITELLIRLGDEFNIEIAEQFPMIEATTLAKIVKAIKAQMG